MRRKILVGFSHSLSFSIFKVFAARRTNSVYSAAAIVRLGGVFIILLSSDLHLSTTKIWARYCHPYLCPRLPHQICSVIFKTVSRFSCKFVAVFLLRQEYSVCLFGTFSFNSLFIDLGCRLVSRLFSFLLFVRYTCVKRHRNVSLLRMFIPHRLCMFKLDASMFGICISAKF